MWHQYDIRNKITNVYSKNQQRISYVIRNTLCKFKHRWNAWYKNVDQVICYNLHEYSSDLSCVAGKVHERIQTVLTITCVSLFGVRQLGPHIKGRRALLTEHLQLAAPFL